MKNTYQACGLILVFVASLTCMAQDLRDYYPLEVQNTWTFQNGSHTYSESIVSTMTDSAGNVWYLFDSFRRVDSVFVRFGADNNLYLLKDSVETIWLRFGALTGETWRNDFYQHQAYKVSLESKTETVRGPIGVHTMVYRFYFKWQGVDNDLEEMYAKDIGPIRRTLYGFGVVTDSLIAFNRTTSLEDIPDAVSALHLGNPYPNPSTSVVSVSLSIYSSHANGEYVVTDLLGRIVHGPKSFSLSHGTHGIDIPVQGLGRGSLLLTLVSGTSRYSRIIQRW
jgi:hypothetical protein